MDLLEYRLNILNDIVDYFVLVESTHTFVGNEKELYYGNNKHKFSDFNHKIIHIIVDDMPIKNKYQLELNKQVWENEYHQRNCIKRGLDKLNPTDDSIVLISDIDEIPEPKFLTETIPKVNMLYSVILVQYWYNLNTLCNMLWNRFLIGRYIDVKNYQIQHIRDGSHPKISNYIGGWHLSYFGDVNFIHNKLNNFAHQEKEVQNINTLEEIQKRIDAREDLYFVNRGWKFTHIPEEKNTYLPPQYKKYLSKYIS